MFIKLEDGSWNANRKYYHIFSMMLIKLHHFTSLVFVYHVWLLIIFIHLYICIYKLGFCYERQWTEDFQMCTECNSWISNSNLTLWQLFLHRIVFTIWINDKPSQYACIPILTDIESEASFNRKLTLKWSEITS